MKRYILRFCGQGARPDSDVARIRSLPNLKVLDDDSPRMLLIEAPANELKELADVLPDWEVTPERMIPLPDQRPKVRK